MLSSGNSKMATSKLELLIMQLAHKIAIPTATRMFSGSSYPTRFVAML